MTKMTKFSRTCTTTIFTQVPSKSVSSQSGANIGESISTFLLRGRFQQKRYVELV